MIGLGSDKKFFFSVQIFQYLRRVLVCGNFTFSKSVVGPFGQHSVPSFSSRSPLWKKTYTFCFDPFLFSSDKKKYSQFHLWSHHFRQCQHGWSALDPIIFLQCFEKKKIHFPFHIWSTLCPFFTSLYNALKSFPKL